MSYTQLQRLSAEALGTAALLIVVVGSGIMAEDLSGGNVALALLANSIAVGALLVVLIEIFGPVSGAHFNPAVTVAFLVRGEISPRDAAIYIIVQIIAGCLGVVLTHAMFDMTYVDIGLDERNGVGLWLGEFVAVFGLILTIFGCVKFRPEAVPHAVGLYIASAIWFTSSTCFANPAVTVARMLTDSFTGIRPIDGLVFIVVQLVAALCAVRLSGWLFAPAAGAAEHE